MKQGKKSKRFAAIVWQVISASNSKFASFTNFCCDIRSRCTDKYAAPTGETKIGDCKIVIYKMSIA